MIHKLTRTIVRTFAFALALCATTSAWADITKANPVTGATETYSYTFTGGDGGAGTDWNIAANWSPNVTPYVSGANAYNAALVDGKTVTTSAQLDGWDVRFGAYNSAAVTVSLNKFQGDSTMWMTADSTSKITVNGFGKGNVGDNQTINLTSANAGGITWTVDFQAGSQDSNTINYYLGGTGTVVYAALKAGSSNVIRKADVNLAGGDKAVKSKQLVSFTSTTKTFTANADIVIRNSDGTEELATVHLSSVTGTSGSPATDPTITTSSPVGACELVQKSDGIYLYYVDGPTTTVTRSISVNFQSGSTAVSTSDGAGDYAVDGTFWNTYTSTADGAFASSLSAVNERAANGIASMVPSMTVTVGNTRGSYHSSSTLPILQGYIDDGNTAGNAPYFTVTSIPYDFYKVILYFSGDSNGAVGYVTANDMVNLKGDSTSGYVIGDGSWGSLNKSASSYDLGGNYFYTPVFAKGDGTLKITGHVVAKGTRSRLAAFQIVEVTPTAGTYTFTPTASTTTALSSTSNWDAVPDGTVENVTIDLTGSEATINVDVTKTFGTIDITNSSGGAATLIMTGSALLSAAQVNVPANVTLKIASTVSGGAPVLNAPIALADATTELEVAVATSMVNSISGSGKVKVSANAVTFKAANTFTGGLTIASGGLAKTTTTTGYGGKSLAITVASGGTLDICGEKAIQYSVSVAGTGVGGSGAIINSVSGLTHSGGYLNNLTLSGDATLNCDNNLGVGYDSGCTLGLDSHTLTLTATQASRFFVHGVKFTAGTIILESGVTYYTNNGNGSTGSGVTLQANSGAGIELGSSAVIHIGDVTIADGASLTVAGTMHLYNTHTLNVQGTANVSGTLNIGSSAGSNTNNTTLEVGGEVNVTGSGKIVLLRKSSIKKDSDGNIDIGANATVEWNNHDWDATAGDVFTGTGTLLLSTHNDGNRTYTVSSSFSGTLQIKNGGSWPALAGARFANRPTANFIGNVAMGGAYTAEAPFVVKNLTGTGNIDATWSGGNNVNRHIDTLQTADTTYSGQFLTGSNSRNACLTVRGEDGVSTKHSLTLSGASTSAGTLVVTNNAKVVFTSGGGWASAVVTVGKDGYLESSNTTANVASTLALKDGGTVVIATSGGTAIPLKAGAVTLPEDGYALIDVSSFDLEADAEAKVIDTTSFTTASDIYSKLKASGKQYSLTPKDDGIYAVNDGGLNWTAAGGWSKSDEIVGRYVDALITSSSDSDSVPLTTDVVLDTLTLGGEGTVTFTSSASKTIKASNIVIGANVKLNVSDALDLTGVTITGDGELVIPNGVTYTIDGADVRVKTTVVGLLITTGETKLASTANTISGTLDVLSGETTLYSASCGLSGGTLTIEPSAKLIGKTGDTPNYLGSSTINVYGELQLDAKWSLEDSNNIYLYNGCIVSGSGNGTSAFDLCGGTIYVKPDKNAGTGTVSFGVNFGLGGTTPVNVEADMAIEITGKILQTGYGLAQGWTKNGDGTMELTPSSMAAFTGAWTVNAGKFVTSKFPGGAVTGNGTVEILSQTSGGSAPLNNFTDTNTTLVLDGISGTVHIGSGASSTVSAKLVIDGSVGINNGNRKAAYTFTKIADGDGTLSLSTWNKCYDDSESAVGLTYTVSTIDADGFSGTIALANASDNTDSATAKAANCTFRFIVGNIIKTDPQYGTPLVKLTKSITQRTSQGSTGINYISYDPLATTLNGESRVLMYDDSVVGSEGIYLAAAKVTTYDANWENVESEDYYTTVEAALSAAAGGSSKLVTVYKTGTVSMSDTSSPLYVTLAAGVEFTLVSSKAGYGYTFVEMGGIRNYVYNRVASTFTWAADTAANWNSVANWTVDGIVAARLPDSDDDVVFPAGTHTVILSTKNGTEKCASINIDSGSLTLQYSGNSWVELYLHGNISGNGTLSLSHVCLNNRTGSDIEVSCPVEIAAVTGDSAFIGDGSWTISGDLEVNGYLKAQSTPVTVSGDAEFASSGVTVETQAAITFTGDTTFNGGFSRNTASGGQTLTFGDVTVTAATTVSGSRPNAFTGTVMLEDGASLTVTTAATTVESATFTAWDPLYKVVSTVVDSTTVYSVERRPGTIFTVY